MSAQSYQYSNLFIVSCEGKEIMNSRECRVTWLSKVLRVRDTLHLALNKVFVPHPQRLREP